MKRREKGPIGFAENAATPCPVLRRFAAETEHGDVGRTTTALGVRPTRVPLITSDPRTLGIT